MIDLFTESVSQSQHRRKRRRQPVSLKHDTSVSLNISHSEPTTRGTYTYSILDGFSMGWQELERNRANYRAYLKPSDQVLGKDLTHHIASLLQEAHMRWNSNSILERISWDEIRVIATEEGHSNSAARGHSSSGYTAKNQRYERGRIVSRTYSTPWYH